MEWEQLKTEVENAVGKRLDQLQGNLETQRTRLQETITKVQGFAELLKNRMPNGGAKTPEDECEGLQRAQTARTNFKSEIPIKPVTADPKKSLKKEEDKKKPEDKKDDNKTKLEEAKKKKIEEDAKKKETQQKKKEEEDAKKKEALMKKKEEEEVKKKEIAAKKKEEEEKKKEEAKKKTEEAKEKKKQEDLEKKAKVEEAKKKVEEEKIRKKEEDDKKKEEAKKKLEEEKQKKKEEDDKKKEEAKKKIEEEKEKKKIEEQEKKGKSEETKKKTEEKKKKTEETKKKPEENKKKIEEEKKRKENSKKTESKLNKNISPKTNSPKTEEFKTPELSASSSENHEKESEKPKELIEEIKTLDSNPLIENLPQNEPPGRPSEGRITAQENMPQMSLEEVQILINNIKNNCSDEELNVEKSFDLSAGAKSALSLLTTMDDEKFYFDRIPREEVIWTFRLFFVLMKLELPDDDEEAWKVCREFLMDARNKDKNNKSIDRFIIEKIGSFDFSNENIDKLEVMIYGKDNLLQPQYYTEFCALTGLLMFAVREAAIYGGAIKGKIPIWRQYKRLLHKHQQLENVLLS
ncbi:hypothetical protein SteCoe_23422 [Stentor coeruleus]|uniref:Uncharacterized protein n=1 Tax=Stentor coeruleus TaxID=5963 RepID=A0A1R2BJX5_9CILI|nr:hypothetical protein SteCoe_23422 [Stentor coeruleus]